MEKIFSNSSNYYQLAQKYLRAESVNYGINSDANKWGGTSKISDNTALFSNINGNKYIVTMFIDRDWQVDATGSIKDSGPYQIKNATNAVVAALTNGSGAPVNISSGSIASLSADEVKALKQNQSVYEQAAEKTKVPWQLLAAIHYRETDFSTTNSNMYQITGYSGPSDFLSQTIAAGNFLQNSSVPANLTNHRAPLQQSGNDTEEIKDTLYSYNGRAAVYAQQAAQLGFNPATQPYEGSPYVMNEFDAIHKDMQIITRDGGGLDGIDTRPGAFTVYAALIGYSGSGCVSGSGSLPAGNSQQLADQILNNSNVTYDNGPNGYVAQPFKDLAAGKLASNNMGCSATAVSTHILQEILILAANHKVNISSLTTDHACSDVHTVGRAVDINIFDNKHLGTGSGPNQISLYNVPLSNTLMAAALPALPGGSGFGDCDGHSIPTAGKDVNFFADNCNHVHTQVPPGT